MKIIKGIAQITVTVLYCCCCLYYCLFALYNSWFENIMWKINSDFCYTCFHFGENAITFGFLVLYASLLACALYSILLRKLMNGRRIFYIWGLPLLFFLILAAETGISSSPAGEIVCFILALVLIAEAVYAVWLAVTKRVV